MFYLLTLKFFENIEDKLEFFCFGLACTSRREGEGSRLDLKLYLCLRILASHSFLEYAEAPLSFFAQPRPDYESSSSAFLPYIATPADSGVMTFNLDPIVRLAKGNFYNLCVRIGDGVTTGFKVAILSYRRYALKRTRLHTRPTSPFPLFCLHLESHKFYHHLDTNLFPMF